MMYQQRKLTQRVHRQYLLREAEHFREHKKGISEWLKNSDDSYIRHEEFDKADFKDVPIILNISKTEVSCLDFGGAIAKDMIEHIPYYGSPDAATLGRTMGNRAVSGGHGNGGKYYALSQFEECQIISYYKGKLSKLTLTKEGDYVNYEDEEFDPEKAIKLANFEKWVYFRKERKDLLYRIKNRRLNFFCWKGINPRDNKQISNKRKLNLLLSSISSHPQSRSALRSRDVTVLYNGKVIWRGMKPEEAEIDESFGTKEFALPNELGGYKFNKHLNSILRISLSKKPLTGEKSSLNILEIDAFGKNIAYYDLPSLMIDKGLSKSLAAHIDCPELKEYNCVSNDRFHLIEANEVTSIFLNWCKSKIHEVLEELTNKEKKQQQKKELEELGTFLKDIVDEVSDLLEEENLLKLEFSKTGKEEAIVEAPTDKPGYGGEGEIKKKGKGKRKGGKEIREDTSEKKRRKSKLKILLSNHDEDPLNPPHTYDMIERQPLLFQRAEDVDHGIWWINSQKNYIKKIKIKDPGAMPFYFFLVKEIVFSHRFRRRYKEQERYDPDSLEELNLDLIDEIFNKIVDRLGIELSADSTTAGKIREAIKTKKRFTVAEIAKEAETNIVSVHVFLGNPNNHIHENYDVKKEKINGKGIPINIYVRK